MLFEFVNDLVVDAAALVVSGELVPCLFISHECSQISLFLFLLHKFLYLA